MTVIERIFAELNKQGKSQIELARYLGIAKNTVTNWKLGISQSYMKFLPQIAKYLNVPIDSLVSDDPPLPKPQFGITMSDSYVEPISKDNSEFFVQKIERLLEERNIQKKKMLEDLNLNINTFSVWRKRGTIPSTKVLQKIADYFGVPVSSLFDDSDTPATPVELQDLISRTRNLSAEEIKELDDYLNFIISKRK